MISIYSFIKRNSSASSEKTYWFAGLEILLECFVLSLFIGMILSACTPVGPSLPNEMIVSMTSYSDQSDIDIVQLCANKPLGLYWHEQSQIWAVICKMEYQDMYGAVLMDASYTIISTDHVNAKSMSDLKKMVFSVGWQER